MSSNNSFQQLAQEEEEQYPQAPPATERGVMGNVRVFGFAANVFELYLPKIFEMIISMFGGADEDYNQTRSHSRGMNSEEEDKQDV